MSHGGKQHHTSTHNVFKGSGRKKYAEGGHTTSEEKKARGGRRHREAGGPLAGSEPAMRKGGRRCHAEGKNVNPHTGHPQYFSFDDFLDGAGKVGSTVGHIARSFYPIPGFADGGSTHAEGGHQVVVHPHTGEHHMMRINPNTGHPEYWSLSGIMGGIRNAAKTASSIYNHPMFQSALGLGTKAARAYSPKAAGMLDKANEVMAHPLAQEGMKFGKEALGFKRGGRRGRKHHEAGDQVYAEGGHAMKRGGRRGRHAEGGEMVPLEGKARANAEGGPQFPRASTGGNRPFAFAAGGAGKSRKNYPYT